MDFGEKIQVFIKNKFGNLANFAEQYEINYSTVHNYCTGKRKPSKKFLEILRDNGCNLNYLYSQDKTEVITDSQNVYKGGDINNTINSTTKEAEKMGMTLSAGLMSGNINYGDTLVRELYLQISRLEEENKNCHQQIKNLTEIIKTMAAKGG